MKKALAYLVVAVGVLGVLVVAGTFLLPREAHVERKAQIARPPCTVHAVLNGWKRFNEWSPWAEKDPATAYTYRGPAEGLGAAMSWTSEDPDVGNGGQEIVGAKACESIDVVLRFEGMSDAKVRWVLTPKDDGTEVTWSLDSDMGNNPIGRVMGTQMDGFVGPDFERGLTRLKQLVEGLPEADFAGLEVERTEVPAVQVAKVTTTAARDPMAVGAALGGGYAAINTVVGPLGLTVSGAPRASYREDGTQYVIEAMLPVVGTPSGPSPDPAVSFGQSWSGPALRVVHRGGYMGIADTWSKLEAWSAAHGAPVGEPRWEEYLSDPATTPEPDLQTALYVPLKNPEPAPGANPPGPRN